jgi:hypothetical protein
VNFKDTLINGPGNTVTALFNGFSGYLRATVNSWHGASFTIMAFQAPLEGDPSLPPNYFNSAIYHCNFRIEHGELIVSEPFQLEDFIVTTQHDSSGTDVIQVEPVPGLVKSIILPGSDSTIVIMINGGAGYGTYVPNPILLPENQIPTLSQWGIIIFALLLLTVGMVFVQRKQTAIALAGAENSSAKLSLVDKSLYFKIFGIVMLLAAIAMVVSYWLSGALSKTDLFGTLASACIVAYMLQVWMLKHRK